MEEKKEPKLVLVFGEITNPDLKNKFNLKVNSEGLIEFRMIRERQPQFSVRRRNTNDDTIKLGEFNSQDTFERLMLSRITNDERYIFGLIVKEETLSTTVTDNEISLQEEYKDFIKTYQDKANLEDSGLFKIPSKEIVSISGMFDISPYQEYLNAYINPEMATIYLNQVPTELYKENPNKPWNETKTDVSLFLDTIQSTWKRDNHLNVFNNFKQITCGFSIEDNTKKFKDKLINMAKEGQTTDIQFKFK